MAERSLIGRAGVSADLEVSASWGLGLCHRGPGLILGLTKYAGLSGPLPCQGQASTGSQRIETPTGSMASLALSEYVGRAGTGRSLLLLTPLGRPWRARWRQHEREDNKWLPTLL